jgi:hypothetical protein
MADAAALAEIEKRIQLVEDNLRQLVEQAAAYSGAADEERNADRIADQQAKLDALRGAVEQGLGVEHNLEVIKTADWMWSPSARQRSSPPARRAIRGHYLTQVLERRRKTKRAAAAAE